MTTESVYFFCTLCRHVHLRKSEIGKLHLMHSYKTQKQIKEMELAEKGILPDDSGLEKRISKKRRFV